MLSRFSKYINTNLYIVQHIIPKISNSNNHKLPNLGRWSTIKNEKIKESYVEDIIEKNTNWGNHDHCGSEVCKTPIVKSNVKYDMKTIMEDPYWFYLL